MDDPRQLWKRADGMEGLNCSVCGWHVSLTELMQKVESSGSEVNRDTIRAAGAEIFKYHACNKPGEKST